MIFYFFGKPIGSDNANLLRLVFDELVKEGHTIRINSDLFNSFSENVSNFVECISPDLGYADVDCGVSIGGDGTLLEFLTYVKSFGLPILAVNAGRLGFLATTSISDTEVIVKELLKTNKEYQPRNLISVNTEEAIFGDRNFALNEFAITKRDTSSMITIHAYVDGQLLNSYWADGLLVSTPTGSTGYSLSAGGPLVMPQTDNFVITPINPHSLTVRPVIVPSSSKIRLKVEGRTKKVLLSLDHRSVSYGVGLDVELKKCDFQVNLIKTDGYSYFNTLRNKLNWGLDIRN